jgi:acyl-coenzyme A thioesterase PaaI-like protein
VSDRSHATTNVRSDPPHEAQARLADSVRRLAEATVTTATDPAELTTAAGLVDEATALLLARRRQGSPRRLGAGGEGLAFHFNPVLGTANPYAPPIPIEVVDGEVRGRATINDVYEGPPGYVHGGVLSLILDQTLGVANVVAGHPGMTVGLDVRYRRPTPLHRPLEITSRFSRVEGRTIFCEGAIAVDGRTTVEATGVFRALTPELGRELFADHLESADPAQ